MSEENKVEVPAKFKDLVATIEKMSVLDLSELVKVLEEKFGVSAAAPVAAMAAAPAAAAEAEEEKAAFDIEITAAGSNKIGVIKVIREVTQMGLADAKALVDGAPKMLQEGVAKAQANEWKKKLEDAGAKVTLK